LNRKTFFDVIEKAERVLVSHACFDKLRSHKRNITEEQIRVVVEKNGVIGLTFVRGFLTDKNEANIDDLVAHIDYFCSKFSFRNLAIGTDFFGTDNGVKGVGDYSDFYKINNALKGIGYKDSVIDDIMTRNAQRFLDNVKLNAH
jgi:membrane dipeptidase